MGHCVAGTSLFHSVLFCCKVEHMEEKLCCPHESTSAYQLAVGNLIVLIGTTCISFLVFYNA
jgi:hypothetical protein